MSPALAVALVAVAKPAWESLVGIYRLIFNKGKKEQMTLAQAHEFLQKVEELKVELRRINDRTICDVQDIYGAMSAHNDINNERFHEFYEEFVDLRVKVAAWTGDSNGH